MKEYICIESPNEVEGGMLVREQELIRCKDCKHRVLDENGNARICNHPNNNAWNIFDMHYCGYAKRKEGTKNE